MDRFYSTVLLWKQSDTDEKLMTAQDSFRVAAVRGSIYKVRQTSIYVK